MKKLIAMILCVLLIASMSVTAFAADVEDSKITGGKTNDVRVQVVDALTGDEVGSTGTYKVTVNWGNLLFKIKVQDSGSNVKWDGNEYTITGGTWDHTTTNVTVTNESDMAIKVDGKFDNDSTKSANVDGVEAEITGGEQDLASAVGLPAAPVATYEVKITTGVPGTVSKLDFSVDTIKLTIQTAA